MTRGFGRWFWFWCCADTRTRKIGNNNCTRLWSARDFKIRTCSLPSLLCFPLTPCSFIYFNRYPLIDTPNHEYSFAPRIWVSLWCVFYTVISNTHSRFSSRAWWDSKTFTMQSLLHYTSLGSLLRASWRGPSRVVHPCSEQVGFFCEVTMQLLTDAWIS